MLVGETDGDGGAVLVGVERQVAAEQFRAPLAHPETEAAAVFEGGLLAAVNRLQFRLRSPRPVVADSETHAVVSAPFRVDFDGLAAVDGRVLDEGLDDSRDDGRAGLGRQFRRAGDRQRRVGVPLAVLVGDDPTPAGDVDAVVVVGGCLSRLADAAGLLAGRDEGLGFALC